jgi:hypothetical protein
VPVPTRALPTPATRAEWREQRAWAAFRDHIGSEIDDFMHSNPPPAVRQIVREIEEWLAVGDRAVKLT